MKTCVIRFSSLGDCVLLCPFFDHLKSHGASEVTVVTRMPYAELFSAARGIDRIVALGRRSGWRGLRQVIGSHRNRGYRVIDAHNTFRSHVVARGLGGAEATFRKYYRRRLGLILFKRRTTIPPMSVRYSELGEGLGLPAMPATPGGIDIPAQATARVEALLGGSGGSEAAMAPGSRWRAKRWASDKYLELGRRLVEHFGYRVVLLGDHEDAQATARIAGALGDRAADLAGRTSILEAAAAIARTDCFIGNDSGLMHLAEAVGVPVVALFGPTVEAFGYYPSLPRSKVLERDIPCRPCSRNGSRPCPRGTQECLAEIEVDAVEKAFSDLLENTGPSRYVLQ